MEDACIVPPDRRLQTKKQEFVRQEIWRAAIDLFHEAGFDEVHVDQIAARAGVSRRTFFRYFSSKEDVMASPVRAYGAALADAIAAEDSGVGNFDAARNALKKVLGQAKLGIMEQIAHISRKSAAARMAQFVEVPMLEPKLAKAFAEHAQRGIGPNMEDRILAGLTLSATGICIETWLPQQHRPMAEIVDEVFGVIVRLCVPASDAGR